MDPEVHIRPASQADISTLLMLRELMLIELGSDDTDRLSDLCHRSSEWMTGAMSDGSAFGWLAERDGRLLGGVSMTVLATQPQYRSPRGQVASVYGLYVMPQERGVGIATRLVRVAVSFAKQSGLDLVTLHSAERARPLYERVGFSATSEMRLFTSEWDAEGE